ncbi:ABC-F family ATP-binding cassette domain-containing protein [Demequina zhanjiangensis]|uniref:ABC-F family ATP-binding cassette domain-containing protein n=1 Tax=Demequina zhanjiangensis TaxID=3051659 RepID=A0ABT8FXN5_9MICO|nr:ABC-F family ATP-binding cassette domain-containing protein [Demequina sp. SYSU T00b26]MDN4471572.1 ABC-F family ATP-binding cassette domain-containing protein [Demequina sp. SYSU T00b26]
MAATHPLHSDNAATQLIADGVSFSYPDRRVLTDVSLTISGGERVGLIGENGSGKSTLLRLAAGALTPDTGAVRAIAPGGRAPTLGLLHQEPPFTAAETVAEALERAVSPARRAAESVDHWGEAIAQQPEDAKAAESFAAALEEAERLDAWTIEARIGTMLDGLGLIDIPGERPTGRLSGGQRARLSLAWLLLAQPDVLLLDEPTNHLDDAATSHLVAVLRAWRGPVVLASHDRAFLDEVATTLVDLDPAPVPHRLASAVEDGGPGSGVGATRYGGSFTQYLADREATRQRWERQYRDEQAELRRLRAGVRDSHQVGHADWKPRTEGRAAQKFYADRNATVVARRVNDARSRLEDLEERQIRKPPTPLAFGGLDAGKVGRSPASTVGHAAVAADVTVARRLAPLSLAVAPGEHLLITGANGSGKSTLLAVLAGRLPATGGSWSIGPGLSIGLLAQYPRIDDPAHRGPGLTARQAYEDATGPNRPALSSFGLLHGRDENRPALSLSVGQQRRLALAIVLADPPDVLLLDEPTNHLSLALVTALEEAIPAYAGTVIVASHDRWLRERWSGERLHLE